MGLGLLTGVRRKMAATPLLGTLGCLMTGQGRGGMPGGTMDQHKPLSAAPRPP